MKLQRIKSTQTKLTLSRNFIIFISIVCLSLEPQAQNPVSIDDFVPPSPTAMAMTSHGDTDVNYFTGRQQLSIPLWIYQDSDLSWPLSIDYIGGNGIKVEEIATNVGLGWTLGGVHAVSRVVNGLPDDMLNYGWLDADLVETTGQASDAVLQSYYNGSIDTQPDMFSYSINGLSGRFFIQKDGFVNKIPLNKSVKIEYFEDANKVSADSRGNIYKFIITDAGGLQFVFEDKEYSKSISPGNSNPTHTAKFHVSSWRLSQVIYPFEKDSIQFAYESFTAHYSIENEVNDWFPARYGFSAGGGVSNIELRGKRLVSIGFPNKGQVDFNYNTGINSYRCDYVGQKAMRSIDIQNGDLSKRFTLTHDGTNLNCSESDGQNLSERLTLTHLQEASGNDIKPAYQFIYSSTKLPPRNDKNQDHWGYYNGTGNTTLIPEQIVPYLTGWVKLPGANRNAHPGYADAEILEKVIYPTGGFSVFEYELNQCHSSNWNIDGLSYETEFLNGYEANNRKAITVNNFNLPSNWVNFEVVSYPSNWDAGCGLKFELKDSNLNLVASKAFINGDFDSKEETLSLSSGTYYIEWSLVNNPGGICEFQDPFYFKLTWINQKNPGIRNVGGVRIKRIIDNDGIGNSPDKIRTFSYLNEEGISSGYVSAVPIYHYNFLDISSSGLPTSHVVRTAMSGAALTYSQGNVVGYSRVEVNYEGDGKEEYRFTSPNDVPDLGLYSFSFPYAPTFAADWLRGLMLSKRVFRLNLDSSYSLLYHKENQFNMEWSPFDQAINYAIKMGINSYSDSYGSPTTYRSGHIVIATGRNLLQQTTETFKLDGIDVVKTTDYSYESTYDLLRAESMQNSDGRLYETLRFYPFDYHSSADDAIIPFVNNHIISKVINTEKWVTLPNDSKYLLGSSVIDFDNNPVGVVPSQIWSYVEEPPISLSEYGTFNPGQLLKNSSWFQKEMSLGHYTQKQKPREVQQKDGIWTTYLWGYNDKYLVAKIVNARYSVIEQILGANPDTLNGLTPSQISSLQSSPLLNNSQLTIFTYQDGYGLDTVIDLNEKSKSYHYDNLGRMIEEIENTSGIDYILRRYEYIFKTSN